MSKRYRLVIILLIMGVCFLFLLPTIQWYFWTSPEDQNRALGTREEIRNTASDTARRMLNDLWDRARNNEDLPEEMSFLIPVARSYYRETGQRAPASWNARNVLGAFPSYQEALSVVETHYRDSILALKDLQRNAVQLGLDLSGGLSIVLEADLEGLQSRSERPLTVQDRENAVVNALDALNMRIDRFGLTEPVIRRQGANQIYVEIPGTADPERINDIIMGMGSLVFHIVDYEETIAFNNYYNANPMETLFDEQQELINPYIVSPNVIIRGVYDRDEYGLEVHRRNSFGNPEYVALRRHEYLDGTYIRDVAVNRSQVDGRPMINFQLSSEGGEIFHRLTSANIENQMAIVLEGRVRSMATIRAAIRTDVSLEGFSSEEANVIYNLLRTAALPVELNVINQQAIGATLGADTINRGISAIVYGLAGVFIFMLLYYKTAGFNAIIAQLLNFYIMFSILSAFNFTLTLPSIAGFILTIGMATDANVIIFERMKEELRLGKSRKLAIETGFEKAFWAIMDSNITTFIAAIFLSWLGTGPVRGFAVTLAIGVFSSVFTSLFVSRLIFDFGTDVLKSKRLSVSWFIKG